MEIKKDGDIRELNQEQSEYNKSLIPLLVEGADYEFEVPIKIVERFGTGSHARVLKFRSAQFLFAEKGGFSRFRVRNRKHERQVSLRLDGTSVRVCTRSVIKGLLSPIHLPCMAGGRF